MKKLIVCIIALTYSMLRAETNIMRIGAHVIDMKTGVPLEGALVRGGFGNDNGWRALIESAPINEDFKTTDKDGNCWVKGETNTGEGGCAVRKPPAGYYKPRQGTGFDCKEKTLEGNWLPDNNVITIALQRVEHPIPLFVKRIEHQLFSTNDFFEQTGNNLAFDLLKGDWLPPKGSGSDADIIFKKKNLVGDNKRRCVVYKGARYLNACEMTTTFLGDDNGVIPVNSEPTKGIRLRTAPEKGYDVFEIVAFCGSTPRVISSRDENKCYYFRIRTKRNEKGEIVSAYYGKIYGDIGISYEYLIPEFLYYLNTTPLDRNLEWDMKNNLCPEETRTYPFEP